MPNSFLLFRHFAPLQLIVGSMICIGAYFWVQVNGNKKLDHYLANRGLEEKEPVMLKTPSVKGIFINSKTKKPLEVEQIRLKDDLDAQYSHIELGEDGIFEIWMDKLPQENTLEIIIQFSNGEMKALRSIDLKKNKQVRFRQEENVYNLGIIEVYPPIAKVHTKEENIIVLEWAKVAIKSGRLSIREDKFINSRVIGKIHKNTLLKVLYHTQEFETINGKKGEWVVVQYDGKEGFVFDAYLEYQE